MCPPVLPPPSEIDIYWSDEQIVSFLIDYTPGSRLPINVLTDSSPYQYPPSNLPEGIWYLVNSNERKESAYGFWKAKGEACEVYSNSMINGWRTTLEYFEGMAPPGQITDWLMQEYGITQKELSDKDQAKESRLLCRVFLCNGHGLKSETNPQNCKTIVDSKDITSEQDSGHESKGNKEQEVGAFPVVANPEPNSPPQDSSDLDCFLRGDYLELADLEDPLSHSSSSQNSSCPSNLSDEYFDSSAFLRELVEGEKSCIQGQRSTSRYDFSASAEPNGVVLQPAASGSVMSGCVTTTDVVEESTTDESFADKRAKEQSTKRQTPDSKTESSSNSSSGPTGSGAEKKAGPSRLKKLKTYFCFATF